MSTLKEVNLDSLIHDPRLQPSILSYPITNMMKLDDFILNVDHINFIIQSIISVI